MNTTLDPLEFVESRAMEIFRKRIQPTLVSADLGKYIAIDIDSDDFELDEDDYLAIARLLQRRPDARSWLMCVGEPTTYRIGRNIRCSPEVM